MRLSTATVTSLALLLPVAAASAAGPPAGHPTGGANPGAAHRPGTVALPSQASPVASRLPPTAVDAAQDPSAVPGPSASASAKAKAYGRYCKTVSKKRTPGAKGTPFSLCVTSMAKIATGGTASPRTACKTSSKKHVAGTKGTPFSLCVSGAAKLGRDLAAAAPADDATTQDEAMVPAAPETPEA